MLMFSCDKCGGTEYTFETKEEMCGDVVDVVRVYIECVNCDHKEELKS